MRKFELHGVFLCIKYPDPGDPKRPDPDQQHWFRGFTVSRISCFEDPMFRDWLFQRSVVLRIWSFKFLVFQGSVFPRICFYRSVVSRIWWSECLDFRESVFQDRLFYNVLLRGTVVQRICCFEDLMFRGSVVS